MRALRFIYSFSVFVRFTALGFSLVLPLLGAMTVSPALTTHQILGLLGVATAFHCFAFVSNDVIDLPIDRTEKRRSIYPLVRGSIQPWHATVFALAQIPLALLVHSWLQGSTRSLLFLGAAFLFLTIYNIGGKRFRVPLLTDFAQGVGWACLILYGAIATAPVVNVGTSILVAFEIVFIMMVNGVHGSLRDLENDQRHGVRTTATLLGAQTLNPSGFLISRQLSAYTWILQGTLVFLALWAAALSDLFSVVFVAIISLISSWTLRVALSSAESRNRLLVIGMLHLIVSFLFVIAAVGLQREGRLMVIIVTAYALPIFAHEWIYDSMRGLWPSCRRRLEQFFSFLELGRLENCLAAAMTTLLGAYVSGGWKSVRSETVILVTTTLSLIVAFSNVLNDCRDIEVDSINNPQRPIPSGRVSTRAASAIAALLAATALVVSYRVSLQWFAVALVLLMLGASYSYHFKNTILIGNGLIGSLCGVLAVAGGLAAGALTSLTICLGLMISVFMFAYEVLNSLADREGDAKLGINTVATRWSGSAALGLFQGLELLFILLALAPWILDIAPDRYLSWLLPCSIGPTLAVVANVSSRTSEDTISRSRQALKFVWFSSCVPMIMLR